MFDAVTPYVLYVSTSQTHHQFELAGQSPAAAATLNGGVETPTSVSNVETEAVLL